MKVRLDWIVRVLALTLTVLLLGTTTGAVWAAEAKEAKNAPQRVVSIDGAITEIVYALDRQAALVGVDSTSTYPAAATKLPDIGYMRTLTAEPIVALEPDLVIAATDAGPATTFDQLRATNIDVVQVPDEPTPAGVRHKITAVADALDVPARGKTLADRIGAEFDRLQSHVAQTDNRPSVLTLLAAGRGNMMAAGQRTSANGITKLAGAQNAIGSYSGYRPLSTEAVIQASPDWIVLTKRALESLGGRQGLRTHAGLGSTPAAKSDHIIAMDGLLLLGFGPRTPTAARRLAKRMHADWPAAD
ncbi:heme/hemin ABC transporter substrate-binding protein [Salinisphaera orenii]|uniref:heme/hemin ABC transporter substrate-binding protein n=1 Tax=Salinisphaera orenii TaxID=856731 RepID=UPI000DBE8822